MNTTQKSRISGFTLIEVIIVVIIIGILSVYAIPTFLGSTINVAAQADQIAADIMFTQSLSMSSGVRYNFVIVSSTTYQIRNSSGTPINSPETNATTMSLGSGMTFGTPVNLPNSLVAFDGKGVPYVDTSSPGTKLTSTAQIPITSSGGTKTILITSNTGKVSIQ